MSPRTQSMRQYGTLVLAGVLLGGCAAEISYQQGEAMITEGRWAEAVQYYQDAARHDPRNVEVRIGLARSMVFAAEDWVRRGADAEKAERIEEAATAYRRALAYNAENSAALAGLDRLSRAQ